MTRIRAYHRPGSVADALELLARPDVATAVLGGGTVVNAAPHDGVDEVVDLQGLELDEVVREGARLGFGAMVRLQDVVDHEWTPPALRHLARREAPRTIRNAATIGGTVAGADWESGLVAGLLAFRATVTLATPAGRREATLDEVLADRAILAGAIITAVSVPFDGRGASQGTGRTPADTPIVLVAGHRTDAGEVSLAATGVGPTPLLVDPAQLDRLQPPSDFRGSARYRLHLVDVLTERVLEQLGAGGAS